MCKRVKVSLALTLLAAQIMGSAFAATPAVAVAPQYDTSHVYVAPAEVDRFAQSFLATFGGKSTDQVVVNVLPVPSSTTSQLLQTPAGTVSLFGFTTPIPHPFGQERNGYLVKDMDAALKAARENGAAVIVNDFPDPIGRDAVVQWPGGVNMQLYWHTKTPEYAAFQTVPENRVYLSAERADTFIKSFLGFSHGKVLVDDKHAPGVDIGQAKGSYRRVDIESPFGRMAVLVTNGQLPYPFGHETTGYQVADLKATLGKATGSGAKVLVPAFDSKGRRSALVEFPGGYVAEIHQLIAVK
ncbi:putative enzyme related to lactoylglutathione lyase [Pseudomonas sp. 22 E 5]|jgi:predicted enzyme related to lactoylglutathione lyase|uniref:Glyoxalase n=1 Tax=Pseudomonas canadensis TaxID=915099 RepID=A0ABZ1AEK5_9PSED|nr:glyoxalase [Pseudomonas canadensis]CRM90276.1 putative enzyme related to lactoylglutathione lyase [Pseudomonas sp. 22 E 5]MCF5169377.1 glyoxalase [Pseudomonas canadensis]MEB2647976.1 glyoxalase [Pseudomonas canadensis]WLH32193.1 glyoxalase [Pseudomonas canadensis]WNJ87584.1 glyoxalase [Pseudomonas canadensis]